MNRDELAIRAAKGTLAFIVALAIMTIPVAGFSSERAWAFWAHFSLWTAASAAYFLWRDPALVARRIAAGPTAETEPAQKWIQGALSVCMIGMILLSALDARFSWLPASTAVVLIGHALLAASFLGIIRVLAQNSYAASTIGVVADQPVISSGAYAVVRHPMYAAAVPLFLSMPLAMGSWLGLIVMPLIIAGIVARLLDEDDYLRRHLAGYDAYCERVRYRLIPGLW